MATGFPYTNNYNSDPLLDTLVYWLKNTRGVRRFGAAALDLVWVASGKFDSFYETRLNTWDVAAGALIVQEAGGMVSDYNGGDTFWSGQQLVASNSLLHKEILKVLDNNFNS